QGRNRRNSKALRPRVIDQHAVAMREAMLDRGQHAVVVGADAVIRDDHAGVVLPRHSVGESQNAARLSVAGAGACSRFGESILAGVAVTGPVHRGIGFVSDPQMRRFIPQVVDRENPALAKAMLHAGIPGDEVWRFDVRGKKHFRIGRGKRGGFVWWRQRKRVPARHRAPRITELVRPARIGHLWSIWWVLGHHAVGDERAHRVVKQCRAHTDCRIALAAGIEHQPQPRRKRSEEHTSELQSPYDLVCRLLLEKKKYKNKVKAYGFDAMDDNKNDSFSRRKTNIDTNYWHDYLYAFYECNAMI